MATDRVRPNRRGGDTVWLAPPLTQLVTGGQYDWSIENGLHWVLDVVFREDRSRIRAGNAGANLALIRRVAASLLRRAPGKGSGVTKRLKAGWDDDYLLQVIQGLDAPVVR